MADTNGTSAGADGWSPPRDRRRWGLDVGRAMVGALRRSGETQAAFARRHGLGEERVRRWLARVEKASRKRGPAITFAPVRLTATTTAARRAERPGPAVAARGLELVVRGVVVRIGVDFDAPLLRRVVAALEGEPC